jgi:hypothetical protein
MGMVLAIRAGMAGIKPTMERAVKILTPLPMNLQMDLAEMPVLDPVAQVDRLDRVPATEAERTSPRATKM